MSDYTTSEITDAVKGGRDGRYRGRTHSYILKKRYLRLNILPQYRSEIFRCVMKGITLRSNFHHLDSSQAMRINFFYPLAKNNLLSLLLEKVSRSENWGEVSAWGFEKVSDEDLELKRRYSDFGEPHVLDFYLETTTGCKVAFAVKYCEHGFPGVINWHGMYTPQYDAYRTILKPWLIRGREWSDFQVNYHMARYMLFLQDPKRYVVLLVPRGNSVAAEHALEAKTWVSEEMRDHVVVLYWEDLFPMAVSGELKEYYNDFYEKYLNLGE